MDKKLRNRTLLFLLLAGIVAFVLIKVSGRQPVAKISAVKPFRHNIVSSITSNGKVEPIAPFNIFARLDTFVEKVSVSEGQNVKKGQLLLELNVKDASSQLANAKSRLLRAWMGTWQRTSATATGCSGITIHWFVCWPRARRRKTNWPPMNWP